MLMNAEDMESQYVKNVPRGFLVEMPVGIRFDSRDLLRRSQLLQLWEDTSWITRGVTPKPESISRLHPCLYPVPWYHATLCNTHSASRPISTLTQSSQPLSRTSQAQF